MSKFELETNFRDSIKEIDWEKSSAPNVETDEGIDDYGDYAILDNFLANPDDLLEGMLACPADWVDQVAQACHREDGKFPYGLKDPGIQQLIVPHYITPLLFGVYKTLVDTEFIPADCNINMEGQGMQRFLTQLPSYCSTVGNLMYDGCVCSGNANIPGFDRWDFNAYLFLNDHEDSTFNLWDFIWKDKAYSNYEDIMEEAGENPEDVEDMANWLNTNALHKVESMVYEPYQDSDHFMRTRSVTAVKNRLVVCKGNSFKNLNYGGGNELYTLQIGMNEIPKAPQQDQNEFNNDEVYS